MLDADVPYYSNVGSVLATLVSLSHPPSISSRTSPCSLTDLLNGPAIGRHGLERPHTGRANIRVNTLCQAHWTPSCRRNLNTDANKSRHLVHIPMGRFGEAKVIAKATVFLASDGSSFTTGTTFLVDGSITAAYITPE